MYGFVLCRQVSLQVGYACDISMLPSPPMKTTWTLYLSYREHLMFNDCLILIVGGPCPGYGEFIGII